MTSTSDRNKPASSHRRSLRELLRLSEVLIDAQNHLRDATRQHPDVVLLIASEPKHVEMEDRLYSIVDRTNGRERVLHGPVPIDRLEDLAGVARAGSRRWTEAHQRRGLMRLIGAED
jgi:hypothetical protein